MSERYSRLFSLPVNLYATGSPLVIGAGALLKDHQTGAILAQLRLCSISSKTIIGVRVRLSLFDNFGNPLGNFVDHEYLDLKVMRNGEFGQKIPILIPEGNTRMYEAHVTAVVFEDRSIWTAGDEKWEPLNNPAPLHFADFELRKQYAIRFGVDGVFVPLEDRDLWHCACGALNHAGEDCHRCRNALVDLQALDLAELTAEKDARLAREAAEAAAKKAEREAAAAAAKEKTAAFGKKILSAMVAAATAAKQKTAWLYKATVSGMKAAASSAKQRTADMGKRAASVVQKAVSSVKQTMIAAAKKVSAAWGALVSGARRKTAETGKAISSGMQKAASAAKQKTARKPKPVPAGKTGETPAAKSKIVTIGKIAAGILCAAVIFALVLQYGVLPMMAYRQAVSLMNAGQYEEAIAAFEAMDGYLDSENQIEACREGIRAETYQKAITLMNQAAYPEAIAVFRDLGDYKDCDAKISDCQNAMDEAVYQAAIKLMEEEKFDTAKKQFQQVEHYKDSKAMMEACDEKFLQLQKNRAIKMMEAGHYGYALNALVVLETRGLDCVTEIKECELHALEEKRAPYVTHGNPTGKEKKVYFQTEGKSKVHSMTRVDLDNNCVRYTVDCTPLDCDFISFFDPPDGDRFMYVEWKNQEPVRQKYVFDVLKKDIKKAGEMTIRFGTSGGWAYVRNPY